jgi:hypothetical protein
MPVRGYAKRPFSPGSTKHILNFLSFGLERRNTLMNSLETIYRMYHHPVPHLEHDFED